MMSADDTEFCLIWCNSHIVRWSSSISGGGGWSLSQWSSGERRGTPWTGRQSITGPQRDKRDKHVSKFCQDFIPEYTSGIREMWNHCLEPWPKILPWLTLASFHLEQSTAQSKPALTVSLVLNRLLLSNFQSFLTGVVKPTKQWFNSFSL